MLVPTSEGQRKSSHHCREEATSGTLTLHGSTRKKRKHIKDKEKIGDDSTIDATAKTTKKGGGLCK